MRMCWISFLFNVKHFVHILLCPKRYGYLDECKTFLELLDSELEEDADNPVSTLTDQFLKFWNNTAVDLSNEKRMDVLYSLFCVATDRIIMRDDGMITLDVTPQYLEHEQMEKQEFIVSFLPVPDRVQSPNRLLGRTRDGFLL